MMSIDLEKAFNRMDHTHCITSMTRLGASNQSINMVASFLSNRRMRIKLPGVYSELKPMPGGAPQGTKSGNFLFCVAIAGLDELCDVDPVASPRGEEGNRDVLGLRGLAARMLGDEPPDSPPSSPLGGTVWDRRFLRRPKTFLDSDTDTDNVDCGSAARSAVHEHPDRWVPVPLRSSKVINDINCREKCDITDCASTVSTYKETRLLHARALEVFLNKTRSAAANIGMRVNPEKTQLLCVTTAINYDIRAYVNIDGHRIISGDSLTTVGYTMGAKTWRNGTLKTDTKEVWRTDGNFETPEKDRN